MPSATPVSVSLHVLADLDADARHRLLQRAETDIGPFLEKVAPIVAAVEAEGDAAVARFTRTYDRAPVEEDGLLVTPREIEEAHAAVAPDVRDSIAFAIVMIAVEGKLPLPRGT